MKQGKNSVRMHEYDGKNKKKILENIVVEN